MIFLWGYLMRNHLIILTLPYIDTEGNEDAVSMQVSTLGKPPCKRLCKRMVRDYYKKNIGSKMNDHLFNMVWKRKVVTKAVEVDEMYDQLLNMGIN